MANTFGRDILIQAPDPEKAADFYVKNLGFIITGEKPMLELSGPQINLYIEKGPPLGPVLEVTVSDVDEATERLLAEGCTVIKDEPNFPRRYMRDRYGLIYNLKS